MDTLARHLDQGCPKGYSEHVQRLDGIEHESEKELLDALQASVEGEPASEAQIALVTPAYGKHRGESVILNEAGMQKVAELQGKA